MLIDMDYPNSFIRYPVLQKKEWDALQAFHPKIMMCTVPYAKAIRAADTEAYSELMADIYWMGELSDPVYLEIQRFHADKLEAYLAGGGAKTDFICKIRQRLLNNLVMPSNKLLF